MSEDKLKEKFNKYSEKVKKIENITNEDKLFLYSNYKQALNGDNTNEKPSIFNRVDMEKWKAWNSVKGKSSEDSMKDYIRKVKELKN
jgi:acyl-CoA-binding protein